MTKRPLPEQVAEAYLRAARWASYSVRVELEDGTPVTMRYQPGPEHVIYVENVETGYGAEFLLKATASQLPPPGPEDDGAIRAELAEAEERPEPPIPSLAEGEHPGPALVVKLIEAARVWAGTPRVAYAFGFAESSLVARLAELDAALQAEAESAGQPEAGHWEPANWGATKDGDRVRIKVPDAPGGYAEAQIESVIHVHTKWLRFTPNERSSHVIFVGNAKEYTMQPSNEIDIWRPALPDWAAQAFAALSEGGLT